MVAVVMMNIFLPFLQPEKSPLNGSLVSNCPLGFEKNVGTTCCQTLAYFPPSQRGAADDFELVI